MTDPKRRAKQIITDFAKAIMAAREDEGVYKYIRDLVLEACEEGASNALRAFHDAMDMEAGINVAFDDSDVKPDKATAVSAEAEDTAQAIELVAHYVRIGEIADPFVLRWDGRTMPSVTQWVGQTVPATEWN